MGRGVDALPRQRSNINMSSSNWRDGEIHKLLIEDDEVAYVNKDVVAPLRA